MKDEPTASVVLSTYNRAAQVGTAVQSVLSQSGVDLELVVVDDGSTDDTPAVLAGLADPRMRCVRQSNRGLSASRNTGAREARGDWLLFLDDDDQLCDGALEALVAAAAEPSCRVVLGGVRFVDGDGRLLQERAPRSLDDALAGTFLISRDLFHEAGGYLEGMPCSHQTELFLRVRQVLDDCHATASLVARPVVEVERRSAGGRPQRSPSNAYFGERWLVARHPDQYTDPRTRAVLETIAGVNAMRIGREADARRRFRSAIRLDPLSPTRYLRLGGAVVAPIGRRIWLRHWEIVPQTQRPLARVRRPALGDDSTEVLERDPSPGPDSLFLPWRYRQNPPKSDAGAENDVSRQAPMDKFAARVVRGKGLLPVIDIHPGGFSVARESLAERAWMDADLDDEAVWLQVFGLKPKLVICSDLVQTVPDPRRLLSGILRAIRDGGEAFISTPDRGRLGRETAMGPPSDPCHIRQWSAEEFSLLLESCGFEILRVVRRRSSMGFLVQRAA